ncbi:hypothetical protein, partial [Salipiger sp. HF18]|uniref:hypothetical protein n=1 Tax=Salipiger sp. HF18 TaxID=2721557 RepID=UPI001C37D4C0
KIDDDRQPRDQLRSRLPTPRRGALSVPRNITAISPSTSVHNGAKCGANCVAKQGVRRQTKAALNLNTLILLGKLLSAQDVMAEGTTLTSNVL